MTTTARPTTARDGLLRLALRADAAGSAAAGVLFLAAAGGLDSLLGPDAWVLRALGAVFVGYAVWVWTVAAAAVIARPSAAAVIAANLVSTVVGVAALVAGWLPLTTAGVVVTVALALYTTVFADLQYLGLRRA
jgi:hypothetical protein